MIWKRLGNFWKGYLRHNDATEPELHVHETLKQLFATLQIRWKANPIDEEKQETDYHFHFQHGDFHLMAREGRSFVRIHFLFFHETGMGNMDNVRYACNEFNQQFGDYKIVYSTDETENLINLHVMTSFRLSVPNQRQNKDFATILSQCFEAARNYRQIFESICEMGQSNLEEKTAMSNREIYLARETEWMHQEPRLKWRQNETHRHTLQQLFRTFFEEERIRLARLTVVTDELLRLSDPESIGNYDISEVLIRKDEAGAMFVRETATLIVEASVGEKANYDYLVHLRAEEETEGILYFTLTFVRPHFTANRSHSVHAQNLKQNKAVSFLVAYDQTPEAQRHIEFEYQWKELQDSWQKHNNQTEEQLFMGFVKWPNIGFCLYWGRRFFNSRRYYEALPYLENAYYVLKNNYQDLGKKAKERFYELNYYIGFCYAELRCYQRAYFFLDAAFTRNNIRYAKEYVNCLTNSTDFRALGIIQRLIKNVKTAIDNEEENEEELPQLKAFLSFLHRRKGYALIELNKLEEAENLFRTMLDDPESESYALDELTYIQQLRESKQE